MRAFPDRGLYDPGSERDNCGFGMIARIGGAGDRALVETALQALARMRHRGGVNADGLSGDGCGVLLCGAGAFVRLLAEEAGIAVHAGTCASGLVFLPRDGAAAAACRARLEDEVTRIGARLVGWRDVPTDPGACGRMAREAMPGIEQVFIERDGPDDDAFERALYLARRRCEQALAADHPDFYIVNLSAKLLGYKGMVLPDHLPQLYPDLARTELTASAVVFHQRFSTNTLPRWALAHPFRRLAHNGEINSIEGNRRWALTRRNVWRSKLLDISEFPAPVTMHGSDSQTLDNMLEWLLLGGMDLLQAIRILMPPATQSLEYKDADLAAFYEYYSINSEPWDGPAGVVMCDGRYAACTLDRNGLRPARWTRSRDGLFLIASEAGVWDLPAEQVLAKGKLGPGEMIAVDLQQGALLDNDAIDAVNRARAPYKQWLKQGMTYLQTELIDPALTDAPFTADTLLGFQKLFQLSREEQESVLRPLAETEQEATGSMGDDVPMAALSQRVRPLYDHFRQAFAQVTNPPIDPLREDCVMTLATQIGREGNLFEDGPELVDHVLLNSPVLSQRKLNQLIALPRFAERYRYLDLYFDAGVSLQDALLRLRAQAEAAAREGVELLILSDRRPRRGAAAVHALLATGAIHQHLVRTGLRCDVNLIIETGTARDPHHFACLIGYGATAVYPYLAYQTLHALGRRGILGGKTSNEPPQIGRSYRRGVKKGLLKILSKMGIASIASYRGAQLFEIVGLDGAVVELCFEGTPSRIGGAGFARLEADARHLAQLGWDDNALPEPGGLLHYVHGGEYHQFNPDVVQSLQRAVLTGEREDWKTYAGFVDGRAPASLRDLLRPRAAAQPVPLDQVEPVSAIVKRFDSAAMSLGALSPEAHEALAIAMNRLGGRSNSGEGGEDPARYFDERRSKIKQIASGRFGVTPEYLINAEVLQIKIAQGAKPGEGGQLPGSKVDALIARLRYAKPGIGLISPPPHHDIYSIEDLAQLIFDLRQVNPRALISVKLVAHAGVGTIAAGVVKAGADLITVSGHDGGTGASPLGSIRYAGVPWELGLSEARQALQYNGLRGRVLLQTDGGLKTGLDVVKAALLGADTFGFGTAPMIALGCKYLRICHLNNCATGVATQDERLRANHFKGLPERVECFLRNVAEDVREQLALLGARSLDEIVGRTELLEQTIDSPREHVRIDLSRLLQRDPAHARRFEPAQATARTAPDAAAGNPEPRPPEPNAPDAVDGPAGRDAGRHATAGSDAEQDALYPGYASYGAGAGCGAALRAPVDGLALRLDADLAQAIEQAAGGEHAYPIRNTDRAIGARLSGAIARHHGNTGMAGAPIALHLTGTAGQSFGAFNAGGLHMTLEGDANDYVGKGMAGGRLVLRPPAAAGYLSQETPILGNTCLYGATGGELYAAGRAGERFAVRNSGATAVIEGAGDHCCEYMTGGVAVILGRTGLNFGAGFTGGLAYVLDLDRDFVDRYNHELIDILRVSPEGFENYRQHLTGLIATHARLTGSRWSACLLEEFRDYVGKFWLVKPKAASLEALSEDLRRAA
ncbi:glutamate synthase large subunit [Luteimonas sp. RD2P54]|uniref:Glutamate synthase large subunit n=1 Tax=Luteimonas endophytica TaxID=3042023 RepID=A0ABT6J546_9GAMM|nr:glutamate synthase large subunit [Luteimonas endophytica]MDH5821943.1 glutamate synthase large subunit [Luteimonas endophytica]